MNWHGKHLTPGGDSDFLTPGGDDAPVNNDLAAWLPSPVGVELATAGGTTTSTSSATSSTGTSSSSAFVINITWDSSVSRAPAGFTTAIMNAIHYVESRFSDPVTIDIGVGNGEVAGSPLPSGTLGESRWSASSFSYAQLRDALAAGATTASDATAVASMPATSPVSGTLWTTTAQTKALGLAPATGASL